MADLFDGLLFPGSDDNLSVQTQRTQSLAMDNISLYQYEGSQNTSEFLVSVLLFSFFPFFEGKIEIISCHLNILHCLLAHPEQSEICLGIMQELSDFCFFSNCSNVLVNTEYICGYVGMRKKYTKKYTKEALGLYIYMFIYCLFIYLSVD